MSATRRGGARRPRDFYPTPPGPLELLASWWPSLYRGGVVLEPAAGDGAICRWIADRGVEREYHRAIDVEMPTQRRRILGGWCGEVTQGDYTQLPIGVRPRLIITNPPFGLAVPFCEKALSDCAPGGSVVMLMRLGMLGSKKRREFWSRAPLVRVGVIVPRPSFTGGGNDACEYAWFHFAPGAKDPAVVEVMQ